MAKDKFPRECDLVKRLMDRIRIPVISYINPNTSGETGVDVVANVDERRIGVQVTELDTGEVAGQARATERQHAREGDSRSGGVYFDWAENDPCKYAEKIRRAILRKIKIANRHDFAVFNEVWLLVSCGLPERGSAASTFVMTPWLSVEALNLATAIDLAGSKYSQAFLHPILGVEKALYQWTSGGEWRKSQAR
jgi:hypothetical protein